MASTPRRAITRKKWLPYTLVPLNMVFMIANIHFKSRDIEIKVEVLDPMLRSCEKPVWRLACLDQRKHWSKFTSDILKHSNYTGNRHWTLLRMGFHNAFSNFRTGTRMHDSAEQEVDRVVFGTIDSKTKSAWTRDITTTRTRFLWGHKSCRMSRTLLDKVPSFFAQKTSSLGAGTQRAARQHWLLPDPTLPPPPPCPSQLRIPVYPTT